MNQRNAQLKLQDISQAQQERLFHIDFKLRFLGSISRNDLVNRFGIKAAAATRDISLYKDLAPKNLIYDTKFKTYIESENFKPLFEYQSSQALTALCSGLGDDYVSSQQPSILAEAPTQLSSPNIAKLAEITKAISQKKALKIEHCSLSSGHTQTEIIPFALIDCGLRWHVRAYDRSQSLFTNFVLNRILKTKPHEAQIAENETKESDIQWNRIVEMHIVPHPCLEHPETIETEYSMSSGMLKIQVRAAVAGYLLRHWNVDCSESHSLSGPEVHLWLKNPQTLYGVENLAIAPGYQESHG